MALRPKDYGEQYPTDSDDSIPIDPTANFSEFDYEINTLEGEGVKLEETRDFVPESEVQPKFDRPRESFACIIVKKIGSRTYQVTDQNGRSIVATSYRLDRYKQHFPGDPVNVTLGPDQRTFFIADKGREQEIEIIQFETVVEFCNTEPFLVPFALKPLHFPTSTLLTNEPINFDSSTINKSITCSFANKALCEINFVLKLKTGKPVDGGDLCVGLDCITEDHTLMEDDECTDTEKLYFSKQVGFKRYWKKEEEELLLTINSDVEDSLLNQQDSLEPFWTNCVRIGNSLSIGTQVPHGWLKLGTKENYAWISHGDGKIKLKLPENAPPSCDYALVSKAVSGECVETKWVPFSFSGSVDIPSGGEGEPTATYPVHVTPIPEGEYDPDCDEYPVCEMTDCEDDKPCEDVDPPSSNDGFDCECFEEFGDQICGVWISIGDTFRSRIGPELPEFDCGCDDWNKVFPLDLKVDCDFGVEQIGQNSLPGIDGAVDFPCTDATDDPTHMQLSFGCTQNDIEGETQKVTATLTITYHGCPIATINWNDVAFNELGQSFDVFIPGTPGPLCGNLFIDPVTPNSNRIKGNTLGIFDPTVPEVPFGQVTPADLHPPLALLANYKGQNGGIQPCGTYYFVQTDGVHNFGRGNVPLKSGQYIVSDGAFWQILPAAYGALLACEIIQFVDFAGCDWTNTIKEGGIKLGFDRCTS